MDALKLIRLIPKMHAIEKELNLARIVGESVGGNIKAIFNGQGVLKSIEIDDSINDLETIENSLVTAINVGKKKANFLLLEKGMEAVEDPKS